MMNETIYLERMIPFYNYLKKQIRHAGNGLMYYGTGEAGHWAIQSNFNVAGALAVLATTKQEIPLDKQELLDLALSLFRYNLHSHVTGGGKASCGNPWGGSWISTLGLERMVQGQLAFEPYLTDQDKDAFRKMNLFEADWILKNYETVAAIDGNSGRNKPESNYWNGSFLYRTAMDYPDAPDREAYLDKATSLLLNAISIPADAESDAIFRGKPLRDWFVGANFTENYSLDHHSYMNVGYSVITLSHAAYLCFFCKARGWALPPEALHHVQDLWNVVKNFIFPDGRLLRIGGDSRARYCYCQMYLLPILLLMQDLEKDAESAAFERGMLNLLKQEQITTPDGSFFGTRLKEMSHQSRYYYTRLESDPIAVLGSGAMIRRSFDLPEITETPAPRIVDWHDDFHTADLIRTEKTVRSFVRRAAEGPVVLTLDPAFSDMAEWCANGHAQLQGHLLFTIAERGFHKSFPGGFINAGASGFHERGPWGEGEVPYRVAETRSACAALPDGKTTLVLEKVVAVKEHALISLRGIGWKIPNDLFNGNKRTFRGENFAITLEKMSGDGVIDTGSTWLNVDDKLTLVLGHGATTLKLHAPAKPMGEIRHGREMKSLYMNEICSFIKEDETIRRMPGDVLSDSSYAVIAGATAAESGAYKLERLTAPEDLRVVRYTADGRSWIFAANFGDSEQVWEDQTIPAGECVLKEIC